MSFDRKKKLSDQEIESMKIAVNETDIKAIHPDKMEDFAEYMVQSLKSSEIVDDMLTNSWILPHGNAVGN